jgi:ribosomal protein S18 acetylase RimI-like enzyme
LESWFYHPKERTESKTAAYSDATRKLTVRTTIPADLTGVAQIIALSFHSQKGLWGWAFPLLRLGIYEDLRHRLASPAPHHTCLVAVETSPDLADNVIATVELGVRFSDSWTQLGKSFPYLSNLAVHPNYRRRGAASELLVHCEKLTREWGFQDLYLHVLENNHQARQLYFKLGYRVYQVESRWNALFLGRSRQILLHKRLTPSSTI